MPRPTRYGLPTIRRTVFLHPETSAAIDDWVSRVAGRTPGMLIDLLARRVGLTSVDSPAAGEDGIAPAQPSSTGATLKELGFTVDQMTGDFVPPAGMDREEALRHLRQAGVQAAKFLASGSAPRKHRPGVNSIGQAMCLDCKIPKLAKTRWEQPCPGQVTE